MRSNVVRRSAARLWGPLDFPAGADSDQK